MEPTGSKATMPCLPTLPDETSVALAVTVRPMRGTDIEQVARIEKQSHAIPWSAQAYITEIANPAADYFVSVLDDNRVVGYGGLWTVMDEAHITTLAVDPAFRGRHIGDRLLCELLQRAQERGAIRATLEVRIGNDAARNLYEKYGFTWAAVRKKYYADNGEDGVIMWINHMESDAWKILFAQNRAALGLTAAEVP